jgi:hypothetical protein
MAMITADLEPKEVGKEFMTAAVRAVKEYFWHHARAALRQIGLTDRHRNMRRVLRWIGAHEKREVSREDIRRDALGQSLDAEQVQLLLECLAKAGWLHADPMKTAGRTRRRWRVNPKLFAPTTAESAESAGSPSRGYPASNTTKAPSPFRSFPHFPQPTSRVLAGVTCARARSCPRGAGTMRTGAPSSAANRATAVTMAAGHRSAGDRR